MRVVITSHGSTGDIVPMIALGRALMDAGHETVFAAIGLFRELIESAGVPFHPVPPDWTREDSQAAMKELARIGQPLKQLKRIYEFGDSHYEGYFDELEKLAAGADVLVSSYLYPMLQPLAERQGAKFAVASFAHYAVPTTENAPLPGLALPVFSGPVARAWRAACWAIADIVVSRTLSSVVAKPLRAKGLPLARSFFHKPAPLALVTVSERLFSPPPGALDSRFVFTGYWRYQTPTDETLEAELDRFCGGDEVPILNFGSVTWDSAERDFAELLAQWPTGKKLIVQSGWAGFQAGVERPEIKVIGHANHDRLFARGSVIIHHGGAGTTASALHSGKPQIVIPHIADQFFWASECRRLGLALTGDRRTWASDLSVWVDAVESNERFRQNAEAAAEKLAQEHGPQRAVRVLEQYVAGGM